MIGPANMKADHEGGRHQAGVKGCAAASTVSLTIATAVLQSVDGLIAVLL
jgi:hypothetical protein